MIYLDFSTTRDSTPEATRWIADTLDGADKVAREELAPMEIVLAQVEQRPHVRAGVDAALVLAFATPSLAAVEAVQSRLGHAHGGPDREKSEENLAELDAERARRRGR